MDRIYMIYTIEKSYRFFLLILSILSIESAN